MMPTLCVVTPSYNQGRFISRTLQSVLAQPLDFDYFVVDGCSTDETIAILQRVSDPRLHWVSEADHGQAHAVNKGIAATHGEIIAWLNSDDIYYPDTLGKVQHYFAQHKNVDVLYGDAMQIDEQDLLLEPYPTEPWNLERLKDVCYLSQPSVFFRRRVVERFGGLDESLNFCMDYEFWLRLGSAGAVFRYMPTVFAGSRMYLENKTLSNRVAAHKEAIEMLAQKFDKVPAVWLFRYTHLEVLERRGWRDGYDTMYHLQLVWRLFLSFVRWRKKISVDFWEIFFLKIKKRLLGAHKTALDEYLQSGIQ